MHMFVCVTMYVNTYISSLPSSCTAGTDPPDPLSAPASIVHCFR